MSWHRSFLFIGLALVTSAWACSSSSSDSGGGDGATCPQDNPNCKEIATETAGSQAVKKRKCVECHGDNMAGSTKMLPNQQPTPTGEAVELYPPNLTGDEATGVGKWTDDQLATAIRNGIDDEAQELCPQMKHFADMSDFEVYSIVKYLRSIPKVSSKIPRSVCPPLKTKDEQQAAQ